MLSIGLSSRVLLDVTMVPSVWPFAIGDNLQTLASQHCARARSDQEAIDGPRLTTVAIFTCSNLDHTCDDGVLEEQLSGFQGWGVKEEQCWSPFDPIARFKM